MSEDLDYAAAYWGLRVRVNDLVAEADDETLLRLAPATPEWRVKDLVAHLAGVVADVLDGNLAAAGSDPWTEVQVAARRDRSLDEILAEWNEQSVAFEALLPDIPIFERGQVIFDAETHEQDLRGALGSVGARDCEAFEIGWGWALAIVGQMRDGHSAGALRVRTEQGEHICGAGEVTSTVTADRFELFRAMTGRRSVAQVEAFDWDGPAQVSHLCFLPNRADDLVE